MAVVTRFVRTSRLAALTGVVPALVFAPAARAEPAAVAKVPTQAYWTPSDRTGYTGPDANGTGLLDYTLAADPDSPFNRAATAIGPRVGNNALQANAHAKADQGRIMNVSAFGPTSNTPAQGGFGSSNYYAFSHWQYVDTLTFFGGSAGEGNVLAPRAGLVDAAHRNGVKVYGNLFFAPTVFGGEISRVDSLLTRRADGTFPVADKLIEVARTQGFDGYFINQETEPLASESAAVRRARATKVADLMAYVKRTSTVELSWYDSFTESGNVGYRERLDTENDAYFQRGTERTGDSMFLDYGSTAAGLAASKTRATQLGRSVYDLHVGTDWEPAKYDSTSFGGVRQAVTAAFGDPDANVDHNASLALFRADRGANTPEAFWQQEQLTWSGARQNPADTGQAVGTQGWRGAAHYVAEKSPLVFDTFVSDFNLGIGKSYYVDGKLNRSESWNDVGLQDVLPTWRFWIESAGGTKLTADLNFNDAYNGGSSLRVAGNLSAVNDLNLYLADIDVRGDSKLQLAFKTGRAGATKMLALVRFKGDEKNPVAIPVGDAADGNWTLRDLDLSAYAGRVIAGISLRFAGSADPNYAINVGRVGVVRAAADALRPATDGTLQRFDFATNSAEQPNPTAADARAVWTHSADYARAAGNGVYGYQVYQPLANGQRRFLGGGASDARYLGGIQRVNNEEMTRLEVVTLSREFGRSAPATIEFWWPVNNNRVRNFDVEQSGLVAGRPIYWRADRFDAAPGDNSGTETTGTYTAWSNARHYSGTRSLMLAADGDGDPAPAWTTALDSITGGQTYTARWWWDLDLAAGRIDVLLRYLAADGTTVVGTDAFSFAGDTPGVDRFLRQEAVLTAPLAARLYDISYRLTADARGTAFVDDVSLGQPIPEPASLALAAVAGAAVLRRRRA